MIKIGETIINPKYIVYIDLDVKNGVDWPEVNIILNTSDGQVDAHGRRQVDAHGRLRTKRLVYEGARAIEVRDWLLKEWHFEMAME